MTKAKKPDPEEEDARTDEVEARAVADDDEPGLSEDEYLARRRLLEARLVALEVRRVTSRRFPRVMYHATQGPRVVRSPAERQALGAGWQPTPVEAP